MDYLFTIGILVCLAISLTVSLNIASGYTRTLSLAHAAFLGLGAYGYGIACKTGLSPIIGILVGVGAAVVGGFLVGAPVLRLRGDFFLIATLGFGEVVRASLVNLGSLTGGSNGLSGIPAIPGTPNGPALNIYYFAVFAFVTTAIVFIGVRIQGSPMGIALRATGEDEDATEALGRDTTKLKLRALVLGAGLAGFTGCLYASWTSFINPGAFDTAASILILAMLLLGGLGSVWGSVLGAAVMVMLPEILRFVGVSGPSAQLWQQLTYGLLLICLMAFRPSGLIPVKRGK